ncbi:MAG: NAD(P)/FAD-dependent oxidoreductase [Gemmatimonadales bacterium]|nr:NAD(P)/FAD-dependent oxidoreductase [Gemmatimonadales bacterium]
MTSHFDTVVIGAGTNGLVTAIALARAGGKVLVVESAAQPGGALREVEFAPGFTAAPLAGSVGWMPPEVARGVGITPPARGAAAVSAPDGAGGWLQLSADPAATAGSIRRVSARDAARWAAFSGRIQRLAGFLGALYVSPPPRIDADRLGEMVALLKVGQKLRGLGKEEMVEVLRTVPMAVAELLDEWFESDLLKGTIAADAVTDLCQGPMSGGTAFNLLHHHVGAPAGAIRAVGLGDGVALVAALVERARAVGVEIRTGTSARQVVVRDDRAAGVELSSGETVTCRDVVSSLDPYRSLLELVDPVQLDPEFIQSVRNIRFRGAASKVLVALDALPALPSGFSGSISIAPSMRYLEQAYDATKYRECSEAPYLEVTFPTLTRPSLAPGGKHVAVIHVQFTPYRLRDGGSWDAIRDQVGGAAIGIVDRYLPGFTDRIRHRAVLAPVDLEREFGLREGAVSHGEMMLDQILFMRPVAGAAHYATPVRGYYLCGSGTHPGGGIVGASGWLAAQAVLQGRK